MQRPRSVGAVAAGERAKSGGRGRARLALSCLGIGGCRDRSPSLDHLCGVVGLRRSRQVVDVGAARSRPTLKGTSEGASARPSAASATEQSLLRGRRRRSGQRGGRKKGRRREGRRGNELCRRRGCLLQKHGRGERRSGRAAVALARITRSRRRRAPPSLPDVEERGRLHVRNKVRLESPSAQ